MKDKKDKKKKLEKPKADKKKLDKLKEEKKEEKDEKKDDVVDKTPPLETKSEESTTPNHPTPDAEADSGSEEPTELPKDQKKKTIKGKDKGVFGGDDNISNVKGDPYYDADFKDLDFSSDINYAEEEKLAFSQPLRIQDMKSMEQSVSKVAKEVSTGLRGIDNEQNK